MAPALGYALTQPPAVSLIVFAMLGLGMAAPFTLLAFALDAQSVLREDLRIVLMSATLPGNLTRDFFDGPVVESLGRAWPVETRYLGYEPRERLEDQVAAAIRKALREEDGSVLAFLPGVAEIQRTVDRIGPVADDVIIAPLTTVQSHLTGYGSLDSILVQSVSAEVMDSAAFLKQLG